MRDGDILVGMLIDRDFAHVDMVHSLPSIERRFAPGSAPRLLQAMSANLVSVGGAS